MFKSKKKFSKKRLRKQKQTELETENNRLASTIQIMQMRIDKVIDDLEKTKK